MTEDKWVESLRKRTHDLANQVMTNHSEIIELNAKCRHFRSSFEKIEEAVYRQGRTLQRLEHQAQVLKWLLGVGTVILCGSVLKLISG